MAELRSVEELLQAYPKGAAETPNPAMPYADFGKEAAYTLALGKKENVEARCIACGLRVGAWQELADAHHDFVSAQAHWEAARSQAKPDAASKRRVAELYALRGELLAQATFYFTKPTDVKRLAAIRKGTNVDACSASTRALVQLIRPRQAQILDPAFKTEWLAKALDLAQAVEAARATESAVAAVGTPREQLRRLRDRTVARVEQVHAEIRRYAKHAFRNDPKLSAAFSSDHLRKKRRKRAGRQDGTAARLVAGEATTEVTEGTE